MSLKGWQFLNDEGKVEASYLFKDRVLDLWLEVTEERLQEIKDYIGGLEIIEIVKHY